LALKLGLHHKTCKGVVTEFPIYAPKFANLLHTKLHFIIYTVYLPRHCRKAITAETLFETFTAYYILAYVYVFTIFLC